MKSTLDKKITTTFFKYFGIVLFIYFILFETFFSIYVTLFYIPKKMLQILRNRIKK